MVFALRRFTYCLADQVKQSQKQTVELKRHAVMASYAFQGNCKVYRFTGRNYPSDFGEFIGGPVRNKILVVSSSLSLPTLSMETPPQGYRRNVGICLLNASKKIFAASRINIPDTWQMPQGGADEGEELINAAMRELREETGVTSAEFLAEAPYWLTYDFPLPARQRLNRRWGTNYKGQAQKWFLFKFTGKEEEINLLGDGSEKPEFKDWSWMLPERVVELAVDFKKPVYQQVMKVFSPYLEADVDEQNCSAANETNDQMHMEAAPI